MKIRHKKMWSAFLIVILSNPMTYSLSQQQIAITSRALVTGKVTDTTSHPISSVTVLLVGTHLGASTDDAGYFQIRNVPFGIYTLKVSMIGYESISIDSLHVSNNNSIPLNIQLREAEVWSSATLHGSIMKMAMAVADSDLLKGNIVLITPFIITEEESLFAKKYGFLFKSKAEESILYMRTYNGRVNEFLTKRYGEGWLGKLEALWDRNHEINK